MKICNECGYKTKDNNKNFCPYCNCELVDFYEKTEKRIGVIPQLIYPFSDVFGIFFPVLASS